MSNLVKEAKLQIVGMTCAACANRIEKALKKIDGVEEAAVNFALERATIKYDSAVTNVEAFQKRIKEIGYGVVSEKVDLIITRMFCAACATRIERALNKLEGVTKATVNFALESASVEYNPSLVSISDIIQQVKKLGYGARRKEDQQAEIDFQRKKEIEGQKGKFIFSLILTLPMLFVMLADLIRLPDTFNLQEIFMNPWIQLALAAPVQIIVGMQFYVGAFKALRNKSANMDVFGLTRYFRCFLL